MYRGKYQTPRKKYPPVFWIMLILALLGATFGGVSAYLSHSTQTPVTNSFSTDAHPVITVDGYFVTVQSSNYPVYLRAAVVPNWVTESGNYLAAVPVNYDLVIADGWDYRDDGFYYYHQPVYPNPSQPIPVIKSLTPPSEGNAGYQAGCRLVADLSVQAVQAVGYTDDGKIAVEDAWGWPTTPAEDTP